MGYRPRAVLYQLGMDGSAGYVWLGVDGWLSDSLVSRSEVLAAGYTVQGTLDSWRKYVVMRSDHGCSELSDLRSIAVGSLGTVPRSVQGARRTRLLTEWEIHQAELEVPMHVYVAHKPRTYATRCRCEWVRRMAPSRLLLISVSERWPVVWCER